MPDCMFIRHYFENNKDYYIYGIGKGVVLDEFACNSIEELIKGYKKILNPEFQGTIRILWDAPPFLKDAVTQVALEAQNGGIPPTFTYHQIKPEDRKKINDSMPEGIELTLE